MASRKLIRRWVSHPITDLKQGSTLTVRATAKISKLSIRSQWRDDGFLSMIQTLPENSHGMNISITPQENMRTSIGREESHILVELDRVGGSTSSTEDALQQMQFNDSKVVLEDGSVLPDSERWNPPPDGYERVQFQEGVTLIMKDSSRDSSNAEDVSLALEVPEKVNLDCDLVKGGMISIHNKIEGDIRLRTRDGDIVVNKLRGHSIDIEVENPGNAIYASDVLEAQSLKISLQGRLRAKKIHANSCNIHIGSASNVLQFPEETSSVGPFDNDDSGAICDISSLYLLGDATINVGKSKSGRQPVRIKSHHGHLNVVAKSPESAMDVSEMTGESLPIVDLGGVNGSCEVLVTGEMHETQSFSDVSCRVHFDSVAPDSVSVLQSSLGCVHVTMDRKVETDLRMISCDSPKSIDIDTLLLEEDDAEIYLQDEMLAKLDEQSSPRDSRTIEVKTAAFTAKDSDRFGMKGNIQVLDGWLENKSEEPDSRFDRKLRGDGSGSVGKIRLDGAANQALQSFQQDGKGKSSFVRPMVVVAGTHKILVETLSWLGNIARRYGFDDKKDKEELGRTATRRGRSLEPQNE